VIQRCLLSEKDLTYKKALELAQGMESAAQNVKKLRPTDIMPTSLPVNCTSCYKTLNRLQQFVTIVGSLTILLQLAGIKTLCAGNVARYCKTFAACLPQKEDKPT